MIVHYGFSLTGKSHTARGIPCQDAHRICELDNGWTIAAVADGVGSARNSQVGARIAVDTVIEFCREYMPWDYSQICIKSMMRTAYNYAYKQILREAEQSGEPVESYDTTLSMVIYDGHRILYGHSGDGAVIGLTAFGDYVEITRPQKGPDNVSVIPLRSGYTQWVIDSYDEDLAAVLLMTDGMRDALCPYLLRDPVTARDRVYVPLSAFFASQEGIGGTSEDQDAARQAIEDFLMADDGYPAEDFYTRLTAIYERHISEQASEIMGALRKRNFPIMLMQGVQDDKTMVALISTDVSIADRPPEFYAEPDWTALQGAWNRKAYPHMYEESGEDSAGSEKAEPEDAPPEQLPGQKSLSGQIGKIIQKFRN